MAEPPSQQQQQQQPPPPQSQLDASGSIMTPDAIAELLASASSWVDPGTEDQGRAHRTQRLADVLFTAQQLWLTGSEELDLVAEKLGDGSRDVSWRLPLGDSGIVDFFLSIISNEGLRPALKKHALRLIGNSCADKDENRARVVASNALPAIIGFLADDETLPFAVPVLYNILVDYEPAQAKASSASLSLALVDLLISPRLASVQHLIGIISKILALLATHETEATAAPLATPAILLTLALTPTTEPEDFVSLTAVALAYLTHPQIQTALITTNSVPILLATFYHLQTQIEVISIEDEDAAGQLKALPQSFVQLLADISYVDDFTSYYPIGSPVIQTLQSWLSLPNVHLQSAACLCLGNVARSDEASFALVKSYSVHLPLVSLLKISQDSVLLHSILSFLKNLAIPPKNKALLGDAGLLDPDILPRIWVLDVNPQVQFAAVSLTRLLLVNTPCNVRRLCAPLIPSSSPDADPPLSPSQGTTQLQRLLDVFARSDAEHTKTEAARAAAAVCRVLHTTHIAPVLPDWYSSSHSSSSSSSSSSTNGDGYVFRPRDKPLSPTVMAEADGDGGALRRKTFHQQHKGLGDALAFLVTQARFPVLRSEVWFVFALMCRSRDGAAVVIHALQVPGAFEALTEAVTGRKSSSSTTITSSGGEEAIDGGASADASREGSGATVTTTMTTAGADGAALVDGLGLEPQQADPSQAAGMKKADRENGLVLVAELVRRHADDLPAARRAAFEEMLKEGGEMLADEKGKGEEKA